MEKELKVECRVINPSMAMIYLVGDMNIYNANLLREDFERAFRQGVKNFVVNLLDLNTVDSAGIGVLFTMLSMVEGDHGQAVLLGPNQSIRKLFDVTQVSQYFTMVASEAEAMEKLRGKVSA